MLILRPTRRALAALTLFFAAWCVPAAGVVMGQRRRRSEALPWLEAPSAPWLDGSVVGDCGFDPLGLASSRGALAFYREAEIKHSRLAMLAAAGWPVSELVDRPLAELFATETKLQNGLAPSVLNGGLGAISPAFWGASLGLAAAFEIYALQQALDHTRRQASLSSKTGRAPANDDIGMVEPGDLYIDPLGFLPTERLRRKRIVLSELKHGRAAMVAVVAYAAEEYILNTPVVEHSHVFFKPFWLW